MSLTRTLRDSLALSLAVFGLGCQAVRGPVVSEAPIDPALVDGSASPAQPLAAGEVFDLDLVAGTSWRGELEPAARSLLVLTVEQLSIDVRISVTTPAGLEIASADGGAGIGTEERLAAELQGEPVHLFLSPSSQGPQQGRVRLRIETLRPWLETDVARIELTALGQEAAHLDASGAPADWERSYRLSLEELEGWRELGDTSSVLRALNRVVSLERELEGKLDESVVHGREAVALSVAAKDVRAEAASRYWLGWSLERQRRSEEAYRELALGLEKAEEAGDLGLQGRILNRQGIISKQRGNHELAHSLYIDALDRRTRAHDLKGVSWILNNLGVLAAGFGEYREALGYYRQSIDKARPLSQDGNELYARGNMSRLLADRGQWQEALDAFNESLARAKEIGDLVSEANLGSDLAVMLLRLGEPERAQALLERSLEIERANRDPSRLVIILSSLAAVHSSQNRFDRVEALLNEALETSRAASLATQEAFVLRRLANLALRQGHPERALEQLEETRRTAAYSTQPVLRAVTLRDLGEAHLALGQPTEALLVLAEAVESLDELAMPELRFEISYQTARAHRAEGDLNDALTEAEAALDGVESLRSSVNDPDLRATFLARVHEAYAFSVELLIELHQQLPEEGYDRRAFTTLERAKARSLAELLARARSGAERDVEPRLLEAERTSRAALAQARELLEEAQTRDPGPGSEADLDGLRAALREARGQLSEVEEEIQLSAPRYASLRYERRYSVPELQAALGPETALIEYALLPTGSIAFVATHDHFEVVELAAEEAVAKHVVALRRMLETPSRREFGKFTQYSRELGKLVLDPLLPATRNSTHLVVVPDGALAYVPFEALRIGASAERYLIEGYAVSYAPSAGILLALLSDRTRSAGGFGFVGFADPFPPARRAGLQPRGERPQESEPWSRLPGARREIEAIGDALRPRHAVAAHMDKGATESRMKNDPAVRDARWIHVAAHALIDAAVPADSAVVLSPQDGEDGYLTVGEVFGMTIRAELVVLSGCETGLGRQIRGEGLIGLTRAFLYAGAGGMQVSLWKVDDATTPDLMASFYQGLSDGLGAPEALRQAKLDSLHDDRRAHPYYWAAFVVIGGVSPPMTP